MTKRVDFEVADWGELASGPATWSGYAAAVMGLGPAGYWRELDAAGQEVVELTGGAPGLEVVGGASAVAGPVARDATTAVHLPGSGNRARAGQNMIPSAADATYTLVFWLRTEQSELGMYVVDHANAWWVGTFEDGRLAVGIHGSVVLEHGGQDHRDGKWHQVAVRRSANGDMALWLDGQQVDTGSHTSAVSPAMDGFRIGHEIFGVNGDLGEVALYEHVLGAAEVVGLWQRGRAVFAPAA